MNLVIRIVLLIILSISFNNALFAQGFVIKEKSKEIVEKNADSKKNEPTKTVANTDSKTKPNNAKVKAAIVLQDVTNIDTLIKPVAFITKDAFAKVTAALAKIDWLDGQEDSIIKNYKGELIDRSIDENIYHKAAICANYIENETFDKSPNLNFNIKKRYLGIVEKDLNEIIKMSFKPNPNFIKYENNFSNLKALFIAIKNNSIAAFVNTNANEATYRHVDLIKNDSNAVQILMNKISVQQPEIIMNLPLMELAKYEGVCNILEKLAKEKPNKIMDYANKEAKESAIIRACKNPLIQNIIKLKDESKNPLKAVSFLGDYINGAKTITQINDITSNDDKYFDALIELHLKKESSSSNVIERDLKQMAKDYVLLMNELHEKDDITRFKCTEKLNARELYYIAVLNPNEIYTSTYVGVYNRLMIRMAGKSGNELLQSLNLDKFRSFIRLCANFNTLNDFLATMTVAEKNQIMSSFVTGLSNKVKVDLEGAIDVADAIGSIADAKMLQNLNTDLTNTYNKYKNEDNIEAKNVYLILKNIISIKSKIDTTNTFENEFGLPPLNKVALNNLYFDTSKTVYEQMFFYGDKDGQTGYNGFVNSFDKNKWTIDNTAQKWIIIKSKNTKVPLVIYANKPLDEPEDEYAQHDLIDYLIAKDIHPTIMVHRGHSYHLNGTIDALNDENKIIILGSCGGYQNLNDIITHCPDGQIVSTKQVGAFSVNTPILNSLHNYITNGEDIDWEKMWTKLGAQFTGKSKALFEDYVPPHKNLGALFMKAYNKLNARNY
jgi:hypothetical protein